MPPTNDFLPFATGGSPNVISQAAWAALAARATGFQTGTALSDELNKVWRQSQFEACVVAAFVENILNINVADDGDLTTAIANFTQAVQTAAGAAIAPFSNLASATTTNLGSIASRNVNVTGTAAITSFGASANLNQPLYFVTFAASLTLTNGAGLILPGGGNIQTAAGDALLAQFLGGSNWRVLSYLPATPIGTTFTNLASAGTADLGSIASHNVNVTGTTGITSFGSSASVTRPLYFVTFAAALTLTDGGALALPGGNNITTAAGDSLLAQYLGAGNWRVLAYFPATPPVVINPQLVPRALILFDSTGAEIFRIDPNGVIGTVSRSTTGTYEITAASAFPSNYMAFGFSVAGLRQSSKNTAQFSVQTLDPTNGNVVDAGPTQVSFFY